MRVAVAQTPGTQFDQWRETLDLIDDAVRHAAGLAAALVVLPECVWPAYHLGSKKAYFDARRAGLPDHDAFHTHLSNLARRMHIIICAGYVEEARGRLFNAACLLDADGRLLGTHRKCFLWDFDHDWFAPGDQILPADTAWGRVGIMICADVRPPEIPATLAARGAALILQPTAWVNAGTVEQPWNPQPDFLIAARAQEFGVPIASASKWGAEGGTTFVGGSLICDATGHVLVQCGQSESTVVAADVELSPPRRPVLTDAERTALFDQREFRAPCENVRPLEIVPCSPEVSDSSIADELRKRPGRAQPRLAFTYRAGPPGESAARTAVDKNCLLLTGPATRILQLGRVSMAAIPAADAGRFAAVRSRALRGVHVVFVFGSGVSLQLLKTRAAENRVFVLGAEAEGWRAIDPRGSVIAEGRWPASGDPGSPTTLAAALAADKHVAANTDIVAGRCPRQYEF